MIEKLRSIKAKWIDSASADNRIRYYQTLYEKGKRKAFFETFKMRFCRNVGSENLFFWYKKRIKLDVEKLIELTEIYDVISFDVFDTLLFRDVRKPTDIFLFMEKELGITSFATKRKKAEQHARKKKNNETGSNEVLLQEIYQMLELDYGISKEKLMEKECELEQKHCYANPIMLNLVKKLSKKGKRMIAVSDMYLSKEFIYELLAKNNYPTFDGIFISGELNAGKSEGRMFDYVESRLGRKKILHIGDNFYSDIFMSESDLVDCIHYLFSIKFRG